MRAKMAAIGLNKPDYLVERENAVKAANTALEALPAKIEQADKGLSADQARRDGQDQGAVSATTRVGGQC